ncbi:MAG: hypothetical protein V4493_01185 [Pseudomonadota bacterium]
MASSPRNRKSVSAAAVVETVEPVAKPHVHIRLQDVIDATKANSFVYTSAEFHNPLIASGEVEINPDMTDEHGNVATRAIIKEKEEPVMTEVSTATVSTKPVFVLESNIPIPEKVRKAGGLRAGRTPVYPFDGLEIGGSFFVADKAEDKPAVKAMASTVAGANARFSEEVAGETRTNRKGKVVPVMKQLRKFKVYDTYLNPEDSTSQKGARVFRVAIDA